MNPGKSLIISSNDLEARTLVARARALNFAVVDLKLGWGQRLDPTDPRLDPGKLGRLVVMVECPAPRFEDHLRARGHIVQAIDHHLYIDGDGSRLDRRRAKSSLEQFVGLFAGDAPMSREERLIAANDRGFWPALLEAAGGVDSATIEAIRGVREHDLANREALPALLNEAIEWLCGTLAEPATANARIAVLGCGRSDPGDPELILVRAPDRFHAVLADALYLVHLEKRTDAAPRGCWFARRHGARPLEFVLLFEDDDRQMTQLEYSGPGERVPLLDELGIRLLEHTDGLARLRIWAGGSNLACFFGADRGEAEERDLRRLADRLADLLMGGNRPLRAWRSSFFQVLRYKGEADADNALATGGIAADPAGEPERNYIVDYLADFLTPTAEAQAAALDGGRIPRDSLVIQSFAYRGEPAHHHRLPKLVVEWANGRRIERPIAAVKLHFIHGGLVILEWQLEDGWPGFSEAGGLIAALLRRAGDLDAAMHGCIPAFAPDTDYPTLPKPGAYWPGVDCMADLLDLNDAARQCFSSFKSVEYGKTIHLVMADGTIAADSALDYGGHTQAHARRPVNWFKCLADLVLEPFALDLARLEIVLDERARVLTTAALVGDRPDLEAAALEQDVLFQRLATVEPYGPRHFYDPDFLAAEHARIAYRRFLTSPTYPGSQALYGITDQSIVLMGHGWFTANVAIQHMACQYQRLFLVGLLYACVFHDFSHELACHARTRIALSRAIAQFDETIETSRQRARIAWRARKDRIKKLRAVAAHGDSVGRIKERFIGFANGLWFDEISTQIQGREMFERLTRELGVARQYKEITAEIERGDALEREDAGRRSAQRRDEIGVLATTAGAVGLALNLGLWTALSAPLAALVTVIMALAASVIVLAMLSLDKPHHALIDVIHLWLVYALTILKTPWGLLRDAWRRIGQ